MINQISLASWSPSKNTVCSKKGSLRIQVVFIVTIWETHTHTDIVWRSRSLPDCDSSDSDLVSTVITLYIGFIVIAKKIRRKILKSVKIVLLQQHVQIKCLFNTNPSSITRSSSFCEIPSPLSQFCSPYKTENQGISEKQTYAEIHILELKP